MPWPTKDWPRGELDPRVDRAALEKLLDHAFARPEPDDLERTHAVVIVRGEGSVLVGNEVFAIRPFDLVRVPSGIWHQFRAADATELGFLCLVDAEHDRPVRPTEAELQELRADPEVAAFIRT